MVKQLEISNSKPLKIYKASAGSGKTYRLALEYIKLVICDPKCYDKILAVTFTNKATKEMKNRIMKELYGIGQNLPDSKAMLQSVIDELSENQNFIQYVKESKLFNTLSLEEKIPAIITLNAKQALYNILHDYSRFRIETIDSFFQSILRNLAKELGLGAYLNIELDSKSILTDAIDVLFDEVKEREKRYLLSWISQYMKEQIESGKSWKIQSLLEEFGKNIFKEEYLRYSQEIDKKLKDHDFLKEYKREIAKIKKEKVSEVQTIALDLKNSLELLGLDGNSIAYGEKGVWGSIVALSTMNDMVAIEKERSARVADCMKEAEKWVKKELREEGLLGNIREKIIPKLIELETVRTKNREVIIACELVNKNINNLGLLHDISRIIHLINSDRNTFLLAYTPTLLAEMIKESDAPFIYEKIGSHIEHIMIDEFQDTSVTQWDNFKPLIKESLSHGTGLIVGDPKQSIYRFRNGDWRILGEIKDSKEFGKVTHVETLDVNWRSEKRIVDFNNRVFQESLKLFTYGEENIEHKLMQQLKNAYSDCAQKSQRKDENGMLKVNFIEKNSDEQSLMLEHLVKEIYDLEKAGIAPNDIAILVRTNKEIPKIASYFAEIDKSLYPGGNFDLVSDEAYHLRSSSAVEIILNVLRVIQSPECIMTKLHLYHSYKTHVEKVNPDQVLQLNWENDETFLQMLSKIEKISLLPLYELIEEVYRVFLTENNINLLPGQDSYLCFFMDKVSEFLSRNTPNISSLLKHWDDCLKEKSLPSNEGVNGIRILSIHKSKGLEFHSVLIPYCNWSLESEVKSYTKWYKTGNNEPFNKIPILPIEHQKKVANSIFSEEYTDETIQNLADNLNILYVALTRAEKNLILLSYYDAKKENQGIPTNVSELLLRIFTKSDSFTSSFSTETMQLKEGEIFASPHKEKKTSSNPFDPNGDEVIVHYYSTRQKARFKQSIKSNEFIEERDDESSNEYLNRGRLLHYLFSNIETVEDVSQAVDKLFFEGVISSKEERSVLSDFVHKKLDSKEGKEWFKPGLTLYNECSILFRDENGELQSRRPDRVIKEGNKMTVIDFKFGKPSPKYQKQIDEYVYLLTQMGYEATGHIWYLGVPN